MSMSLPRRQLHPVILSSQLPCHRIGVSNPCRWNRFHGQHTERSRHQVYMRRHVTQIAMTPTFTMLTHSSAAKFADVRFATPL